MKFATISASILLLSSALIRAEPPKELPLIPPGPLIQKRAPFPSLWTVTVRPMPRSSAATNQAAGANPAQGGTNAVVATDEGKPLSEKTFLKGRDVMRITFGSGPGAVTVWNASGTEVMESPVGKGFALVATSGSGPNPYRTDLSRSDFPGTEWINKGAYAGQTTYKGIPCLMFTKAVHQEALKDSGLSGRDVPTTALVAIEGRLPVAMSSDGELKEWTWQQPPAGGVSAPSGVTLLIKDQKQQIQQMTTGAVKP